MICAEELMSVMVSLGNPRTMKEIKVQTLNIRQLQDYRFLLPRR